MSDLPTEVSVLGIGPVQPAVVTAKLTHVSLNMASHLENSGEGYCIHWERIDSEHKLLAWINHLTEKNWVTRQHINELIEVVRYHFDWPYPQV